MVFINVVSGQVASFLFLKTQNLFIPGVTTAQDYSVLYSARIVRKWKQRRRDADKQDRDKEEGPAV